MSDIYKNYTPPTSTGLYLKLQDKEEVRIRIASEPVVFNNTFTDKQTGEVSVSTRYAWLVWNYDEELAQILQGSATGFKSIANLATSDEWGDPTTYDIRIRREGSGTDTKYHFTPSPKGKDTPLPKNIQDEIDKIDILAKVEGSILLSDLADGKKVMPEAKSLSQSPESADDGEFDETTIPF